MSYAGVPKLTLWVDDALLHLRTSGESLAAFGARVALWLVAARQAEPGYLPDDDARLAKMAGATPEEWAAVKAEVVAGWTLTADGRWLIRRVQEQAEFYARASESGRRGNDVRWKKSGPDRVPIGSDENPSRVGVASLFTLHSSQPQKQTQRARASSQGAETGNRTPEDPRSPASAQKQETKPERAQRPPRSPAKGPGQSIEVQVSSALTEAQSADLEAFRREVYLRDRAQLGTLDRFLGRYLTAGRSPTALLAAVRATRAAKPESPAAYLATVLRSKEPNMNEAEAIAQGRAGMVSAGDAVGILRDLRNAAEKAARGGE